MENGWAWNIHAEREILGSALSTKIFHNTSETGHCIAQHIPGIPDLGDVVLATEHKVIFKEEGLVVRQINPCSSAN